MTKISNKIRILLVDDEQDALEAMQLGLAADSSMDILTGNSRNSAISLIKQENLDIVVTDLKLRDGTGLDIVNFIQEHKPHISIIIVTAYGSINTAVQAIRSGAYDFLQKPIRMADLKRTIQRLREIILLRRENENLRKQLDARGTVFHLIGGSPKFRQVIDFVNQVAQAQSTILITGESGTGKEVVADAIQGKSLRRDKPFIKINCGAIPENLLESELFGFEKGAFTGAGRQKKGKIELAHEGTLFLDEIGELPKPMQVKLLRVLQNGEFERLGGTTMLKVDIRLIAATNSDLEEMVRENRFREDLFYRLNVIAIDLPPLRERLEDLPILVQYFINKYNNLNNKQVEGIEPEVLREMNRYQWRGNIRELENMIERAVVLSPDTILKLHHFPTLHLNKPSDSLVQSYEVGQTMDEIEKKAILKTLQFHDFDKSKTAMTLQIGLATLYRKLKQFGIEV